MHTILKNGFTSLRKPEAHKRLRSILHKGDGSYGYSEQRKGSWNSLLSPSWKVCTWPGTSAFALTSMPRNVLAGWVLAPSRIACSCWQWMSSRSCGKNGSPVGGLNVEVQGSRAEQHPRVYTRFEVLYRVRGTHIDPQAVARAIELSSTRYCPVIGLLGKVAEVATRSVNRGGKESVQQEKTRCPIYLPRRSLSWSS